MAQGPKKLHHGTPPGQGTHAGANGGGRIGQPPFEPTEAQRQEVRTLAKVISQKMIADMFGIHPKTLRLHFKAELAEGKREAAMRVGSMILTKALAGNLTAAIFYAKTQLGWHERLEIDDDPEGERDEHDETVKELIGLLVASASARKKKPEGDS